MLKDFDVHPSIPAHDLTRAKQFYADKLGLTPSSETPGGILYEFPSSSFLLYPSAGAGVAQHTLMSWNVDDIAAEIAALKAKGVQFEEYDMPGLKTVNAIASFGPDQVAWLKDSEGNILGLVQIG